MTVAVSRWFNRDLLAQLLDTETAARLWEWLRTRPFVSNHPGGYQFHQVVRAPMLRLHRRESPNARCGREGLFIVRQGTTIWR
jgi:hypothetical protein